MKLDSKIINYKKPLTPFDTEEAKKYIGKECYFTNDISKFSCITDALAKGALTSINDNNEPYQHKGILSEFNSIFILPCEWVTKEKKLRPYKDVDEFFDATGYKIGDIITIRKKNADDESQLMIVGSYSSYIGLGSHCYDMYELFNEYEYDDGAGHWKPFGVEE